MPDYREMYQRMLMVSEKAIDLLIKAQQECEELYINSPGPEIRSMPRAGQAACPEEAAEHIQTLFEQALPFEKGELFLDPEYNRHVSANFDIEYQMRDTYGKDAHELLQDFLQAYFEVERFDCLHYFCQGYLAAQKELEQKDGK